MWFGSVAGVGGGLAVALVLVRQRRCLTVLALRAAMIRCVSLVDSLSGFDWSHWNDVLTVVLSASGIAGIAWAAIKFLWNPLFERLTRRRAQAELLDQLACGSSVDYVESLFGPAQFITYENERQQRTYHLPGAWVMTELKDGAVVAFSITVTKRRMYYNTKRLTFGYIKVKLGKSKFGDHGIGYDGERSWIGAYRVGYLRTYDFRRSGAYQRFWLSYNMAGVGSFGAVDRNTGEAAHWYETGSFCEDQNAPQCHPAEPGLDASQCTINTLTVMHQDSVSEAEFLARNVLGPDESQVQRATAIKPPNNQTVRGRLAYRRYQLVQAAKKLKPKRQ